MAGILDAPTCPFVIFWIFILKGATEFIVSFYVLYTLFVYHVNTTKPMLSLSIRHFSGFHANAATLHSKQGKATKAQGEVTRKKKCFPCRTGEKECETTAETKRRKEKDL